LISIWIYNLISNDNNNDIKKMYLAIKMIKQYKSLTLILLLVLLLDICQCIWMPKEAAEWAVKEFEMLENIRNNISFRGTDRRASAPFISGKYY